MSDTGYAKVGEVILPNGEVVYVFPGGLQIPLPTNDDNTTPQRRIQWQRESDGAVIAEITGYGPDWSGLVLSAYGRDANAGKSAELRVLQQGAAGAEIGFSFSDPYFDAYRFLFNTFQESHFVQVADGATPVRWSIDFGTGTAEFDGSIPNETTSGVITHRLGRTPTFVIAYPLNGGAIRFNATYQGPEWADDTQAELAWQLNTGAQAGGTLPFAWLAIG